MGPPAVIRGSSGSSHEKDVPTKPKATKEKARLPGPHADEGGTGGSVAEASKGKASSRGVSPREESLRPHERLRKKAEFQKVYAAGERSWGRFFVAYVYYRRAGPLRIGVVASRKLGDAVRRNRAKRVLREIFRRNKPVVSVSADVVLIARVALLDAKYSQVEEEYVRRVRQRLEAAGRPSR